MTEKENVIRVGVWISGLIVGFGLGMAFAIMRGT